MTLAADTFDELPNPPKNDSGAMPPTCATTISVNGLIFAVELPLLPVPLTTECKTVPSVPFACSAQGRLPSLIVVLNAPSLPLVADPWPTAHFTLIVAPASAAPVAATPEIVIELGVDGVEVELSSSPQAIKAAAEMAVQIHFIAFIACSCKA